MPTRRPSIAVGRRNERSYERNQGAYVRLKKDGLQPAHFSNSADIESRAVSTFEVESGRIMPGTSTERKKYDEVSAAYKSGQLAEI